MEVTNIRRISLGMVAENKTRDTKKVKVWPVEIIPNLNDEVSTASSVVENSAVDNLGTQTGFSVKKSSVVTAEWLGETNRATAPDVRRGEQVDLYQVGDSDVYYWDSYGRDDNLRRLETVVYTFNADPSNSDLTPNESNTYYLEVSTHDKHITLRTSQKNSEKTRYTIQINTGNGDLTVEDDVGNQIYIESLAHYILVKNASQSYIELSKTIINIVSKDQINAKTKDLSISASNSVKIDTNTMGVDANDTTINSNTFKVNAKSTFTGGVKIDDLDATKSKLSGTVETESINASGNIKAAGDVSASSINGS